MSKKNEYELSSEDYAGILGSALEALREAGFTVGVRNAPAKENRAEGLLIYVSGLTATAEGVAALPAGETLPV